MTIRAEYDPETRGVIQFVNDDPRPTRYEPSTGYTGALVAEGSKTVWKDLKTHLPDDFDPRFPSLLGQSTIQLEDDGRLHQRFPHADFSPDAVRGGLITELKQRAQGALSLTDWYVIRQAETGEEIPDDVAEIRAGLRAYIKEREDVIQQTPPAKLMTLDVTIPIEWTNR